MPEIELNTSKLFLTYLYNYILLEDLAMKIMLYDSISKPVGYIIDDVAYNVRGKEVMKVSGKMTLKSIIDQLLRSEVVV